MSEQNEMIEYDDEAAVEFIHNYLAEELQKKFTEDTLYYILDVMCDFYEKNDYLNEEDDEAETEKLIAFIVEQAQKDGVGSFSPDDILMVLEAEEAYMNTIYSED